MALWSAFRSSMGKLKSFYFLVTYIYMGYHLCGAHCITDDDHCINGSMGASYRFAHPMTLPKSTMSLSIYVLIIAYLEHPTLTSPPLMSRLQPFGRYIYIYMFMVFSYFPAC
eukprot:TRINITY_DN62307_c0_g1_i1.p1 TRINITY_DN62307_c0_g1~~TRINITY_DN62307_c0_g1_i1.p1  ORF type:complete len:112 (-),score=4.53 TRINITY_DN62307_c0_g1_i1:16-351(-)